MNSQTKVMGAIKVQAPISCLWSSSRFRLRSQTSLSIFSSSTFHFTWGSNNFTPPSYNRCLLSVSCMFFTRYKRPEGSLLSGQNPPRVLSLLQCICLNLIASCLNRDGFLSLSFFHWSARKWWPNPLVSVSATRAPLEGKQRRGLLQGRRW